MTDKIRSLEKLMPSLRWMPLESIRLPSQTGRNRKYQSAQISDETTDSSGHCVFSRFTSRALHARCLCPLV
ncbi:hypothetical protein F2Q68_00032043 [Brassica cretica]|uniref:Uncharacterized protein n=2 Tax=Brassica cretica TaxID=69181 RepID=A0ABQ7B5Z1_BRACR|nr:hypothetical protein F2Q68_00032043 [Brassica cretica]KAF3527659.1 hypothetical protein DY000_02041996 [Brassica cretica]